MVPVAVDLLKPEQAGMAKFVGGGVGGVAKLGKGVGKAGLSGLPYAGTVLLAYEYWWFACYLAPSLQHKGKSLQLELHIPQQTTADSVCSSVPCASHQKD